MVASSGYDTDVLVVGSGPTGATAALALAGYGVRAHIVSRWNWLADSPRAHITNPRTNEVFRDLGIGDDIARYASPWQEMGDTMFTTSLAKAARAFNLPFLPVVVTDAPDAQDLYCAWQRLREIDEAGALLIRPDSHVARRAKSGADEHEAQNQLRQALEAILAKPLSDIQPVAPSANFTTAKHSAPELFA